MKIEDLQIVIEHISDKDGGGYMAIVPALPGCMSDGETRADALKNVEDAIRTWEFSAEQMGRARPVRATVAAKSLRV